MLINYSDAPGKYRNGSDYYFEAKGFKFEITKDAIDANADLVRQYDFIWLPDNDLAISTNKINALFHLCRDYNLELAQPAVRNNFVTHTTTIRRPHCILRYVNFVELMCPMFSKASLFQVLDTFKLNRSEFGIDWIWAERLKSKRIAIIDAVNVYHCKKVFSGEYYKKLRALGISQKDESSEIFRKFGLQPHYEEYGRVFKPWAKMSGFIGTSGITERVLLKYQSWYYGWD